MYPSRKMIRMNQNAALTDAHAQPVASSSPKSARPRVRVVPAGSARWAIVLLLDRQRAGHRGGVNLADELVVAGLEATDRIRALARTGEWARVARHLHLGAAGVLDDDVVGRLIVLVVERQGERLVPGRFQGRRVEPTGRGSGRRGDGHDRRVRVDRRAGTGRARGARATR